MDQSSQLSFLIDLADSLGLEVRQAARELTTLDSPGGALVRLKGRAIIFLDPTASPAEQATVVAQALRDRPEVADMYLPPEIRRTLESL